MLDEIASKVMHKNKVGSIEGEKSKALNEVKPVKNINKNPQSFIRDKFRAKGSHSFT